MIVAAAVRYTIPFPPEDFPYSAPLIFTMPRPARHGDIMATLWLLNQGAAGGCEQGFLTDDGTFLDRKEAYIHAIANAQPWRADARKTGKYMGDQLFSEDLW